MAVVGVGQVLVPVKDIDRAVSFYRDVLGMEVLMRPPGQPMAFLDAGGVRLYLDASPPPEPLASLVYYRVTSLDGTVEDVRSSGAEVVAEPHLVHRAGQDELWIAFVRDSEGNLVGLMTEQPAPAP